MRALFFPALQVLLSFFLVFLVFLLFFHEVFLSKFRPVGVFSGTRITVIVTVLVFEQAFLARGDIASEFGGIRVRAGSATIRCRFRISRYTCFVRP